ncbi:MAG TPA: hypothetical protein VG755_08055 [Nannocystaceae bacterium]|nr:hypothetical protein [Nannocystaceae bacterium]
MRDSYTGPKKPANELAVRGKSVLARSGMTRHPVAGTTSDSAADAHRMPVWEENHAKVESCAEFAYEEVYDGMRFTDSVAACAGDRECELDIAYLPDTPGVADRVLRRRDARAQKHQLAVLRTGSIPKNDMFAVPSSIAHATDPIEDEGKSSAEADALAAVLAKGAKWYSFGCKGAACGARRLRDEWDFHRKLRQRNATVSAAEYREYERRKAKFRALYGEWVASADRGRRILEGFPIHSHDKVDISPIDRQSGDPFERIEVMQDASAGIRDAALQHPGAASPVGRRSMPATGMLAAPSKLGTVVDSKAKSARCLPSQWKNPTQAFVDDVFARGPAACRLADFLKQELRREAKGEKSCLDLDDDDCDWSPEMFHGRFVASLPFAGAQHAYEVDCVGATRDHFSAPKSLKGAEQYIAEMKKKLARAMAELASYRGTTVKVGGTDKLALGHSWTDREAMGDKNWFAAGYGYDVGFDVRPADLTKSGEVCDLSGSVHAGFGVDAWIAGHQIAIVDTAARVKVNDSDSGLDHVSSKLVLLGQHIDALEAQETFVTTWAPDPWIQVIDVPATHPTFTVWAGPVPITGSAWASIFFGATLSARGELASARKQCDPEQVTFGIDGRLEPQLGVDGRAQVGVGIGGVASAGIRGAVQIVSVGLPVHVGLHAQETKVAGERQLELDFVADIALRLSTLAGRLALYVEYPFGSEEWELFEWSGIHERLELTDPALRADLPLGMWP